MHVCCIPFICLVEICLAFLLIACQSGLLEMLSLGEELAAPALPSALLCVLNSGKNNVLEKVISGSINPTSHKLLCTFVVFLC